MRSPGLGLIIVGALATIPAMFLPLFDSEGVSYNWWEIWHGLDVALAGVSVVAASLASLALATGRRDLRQLAGIAAGVLFGFACVFVPDAIGSGEATEAGLWVVAATGATALAGGVVMTLTDSD